MNIYCIALAVFSINISAQVSEISPPNYIKSIAFTGSSELSEVPIIKIGAPLTLKFDVLNTLEEDYYYEIEHYNVDWTPSALFKTEFLQGFDNQRLLNFQASFNTLQPYTHYTLTIPNERSRGLLVSGNYILNILDKNGGLAFSRKFMIYEDLTVVGASVKRSRDVKFIKTHQSIDIKVNAKAITFNNPKSRVKATVIQNNNLKTALTNIPPQYTVGNDLIYRYTTETSFLAGNEYLAFENKDLRSPINGVEYVDLKDLYHNYLFVDEARNTKIYTYNPDINGSYLITLVNSSNIATEADYVWIHFALKPNARLLNDELYIYGNFNNFELSPETKLEFNELTGLYEAKLLLKQGFYNYKYVTANENGIDQGAISGNFWQTENNYKVLLYYRDLGGRYDRIVGYGQANSVAIQN